MAKKLLLAIERWLEVQALLRTYGGPGITGLQGATLEELEERLTEAEHEVSEVLNGLRT